MFWSRTETPFSDWPTTTPLKDGGIHLTGRYTHPLTEGKSRAIAMLVGFVTFFAVAASGEIIGAAIFAVLVGGFTDTGFRRLLRRSLDIKIFPDKIQVKQRFGYKTYLRNVRIEFRVERHRKATEETLREHRSGEKKDMVYRQAIEAVLQYGERRVVLAEMREQDVDMANALAFRMQDICETQNEAMRRIRDGQMSAGEEMPSRAARSDFGPMPDIR